MTKEKWIKILEGVCLLGLGILFCVFPFYWNDIENTLSNFIGAAFIIVGLVFLAVPLIKDKALLSTFSILGALCLGVGIAVLCETGLTDINDLIEKLLLIGLMSIGALLMVDSAVKLFINRQLVINIVEIVIGAALFASAITFWFSEDIKHWSFLVAGIVIGILGIFYALSAFIDWKKLFRLTKKKEKPEETSSQEDNKQIENNKEEQNDVPQVEESKQIETSQVEETKPEEIEKPIAVEEENN